MPSRPRSATARRALTAATACAALAALTACGPAAGRAESTDALLSVTDQLDAAGSAVATARLAVEARADGHLPAVTADAAISDAVETASGAVHAIGTLVVPDSATDQVRRAALDASEIAVGPVASARTWLGTSAADAAAPPDLLDALDDASTAVERAHAAVQQAASERAAR
ncbi:hypothetical protein DNL40_11640 [Xylanimonas oleitrophica]|uniref:DUF4439 domain-containing protein n=1 Tax=Xylanimonas oleitrophica TaxID=2607479 RepID=A0A2W5WMG4_9MICO|nr:hypothetical protein [Xylanimonas oleitrophica]PZR52527.1 hypothetical protein DNL40_11640 [Xylanimonas oleitrophica]